MKTKLNIPKFFPTFSLSFPHRPLSLSLSFCCFSSCFRSCWNRQLWKTAISTIFRPPTEIDENEIDVDSWAKGDGGWGKEGVSTSMRLELPFWPKNVDWQREWGKLLADTLRKSHGKTLAHFLPQRPHH